MHTCTMYVGKYGEENVNEIVVPLSALSDSTKWDEILE